MLLPGVSGALLPSGKLQTNTEPPTGPALPARSPSHVVLTAALATALTPHVRPHPREAGPRTSTDHNPGLLLLPLPMSSRLLHPAGIGLASVPQPRLGPRDPGDSPSSELACAGCCKAWPPATRPPDTSTPPHGRGVCFSRGRRASAWPILCQGPGPGSIEACLSGDLPGQ